MICPAITAREERWADAEDLWRRRPMESVAEGAALHDIAVHATVDPDPYIEAARLNLIDAISAAWAARDGRTRYDPTARPHRWTVVDGGVVYAAVTP